MAKKTTKTSVKSTQKLDELKAFATTIKAFGKNIFIGAGTVFTTSDGKSYFVNKSYNEKGESVINYKETEYSKKRAIAKSESITC